LRQFGLIGFPLSHSFSQGFFTEKFLNEGIAHAAYLNYPIEHIDQFHSLWKQDPNLEGLNVTIPYKKAVIPFLDHASSVVQEIAACNCIRKLNGQLYGYNTDVIGFEQSLAPYLKPDHKAAYILGTGGASAAVAWVLKKLQIPFQIVSRTAGAGVISYESITHQDMQAHTLIINTSPVGTFPNVNDAPAIPYEALTSQHHLYDLVYNPAQTLFLKNGLEKGATVQNGLEMLHIQAAKSWEIWNSPVPFIQ
jgi:shikimate dehydrogenase